MSAEDLILAFERHATSKLDSNDLSTVSSYGFRGEALPSIASISRIQVISRQKGKEPVFLELEAGNEVPVSFKSYINWGTQVEIFDLFFATPARLKFLKGDSYETLQSVQTVKRLALVNPAIRFTLTVDEQLRFDLKPREHIKDRVLDVWENITQADLRFFEYDQDGLSFSGCISIPTCHRHQSDGQYFFVNNRFAKDKIFNYALKTAYGDRIPNGRYPLACVFLNVPLGSVDVNVHPCKTEVRFLDESLVRRHVIGAIGGALNFGAALQMTTRVNESLLQKMAQPIQRQFYVVPPVVPEKPDQAATVCLKPTFQKISAPQEEIHHLPYMYFGQAIAQVFKTYIISATVEKTFIIDQHAAHERIVYEKYKCQKGLIQKQKLVIPVEVPVSVEEQNLLGQFVDQFKEMGIVFKLKDQLAILESLPSLIPPSMYGQIIHDTLSHLIHYESAQNVDTLIDSILATMACYNSTRKGQSLSSMEMDALLRQMEKTPNIAQCNHGRPTHTELTRQQLDRLFERV